eukprot:scaffold2997_cov182-Amphora_coffeaeformis.AAC.6
MGKVSTHKKRGNQVTSQETPNDHGIPHKGRAKDFDGQKDQKDGKSHGHIRPRTVPEADFTVAGTYGSIGIIRAAHATAPESDPSTSELDSNHGHRHAEYVGREDTLEHSGGDKGDGSFEPNAQPFPRILDSSRDWKSILLAIFPEIIVATFAIETNHLLITNNGKDGVILVRCTHGTENSSSELVVCEGNRNCGHLYNGHQAGANQGSADKILRNIQDAFTVFGLEVTQSGVEFVGKERHGDIHDENGRRDNVGRHGERMLQTNHQADKQTKRFIMGVCEEEVQKIQGEESDKKKRRYHSRDAEHLQKGGGSYTLPLLQKGKRG